MNTRIKFALSPFRPFALSCILLSCILLFSFCTSRSSKNSENFAVPNDTLQLRHARGFAIYHHDDFKEVVVYHSTDSDRVFARYYLTRNENLKTPRNGTRVLIPLETIAFASVTHIEFLNLLDKQHTVIGICSPDLVFDADVRKRAQNGEITDLGDAFNINVERTLKLNPQALMTSGFNQSDPNARRISRAGIPVLYNNEWMENTPLGRAEWIKFVAAFFDKEAEADSIFSLIEQRYNEIKALASRVEQKPSVMSGSNFRGTWYMPGGQSFMARLFADAGGVYFFADNTSTGSLPLNIETVLVNFAETDVWLNSDFNSLDELLRANAKHAIFRPVSLGRVYNFNKRTLPSGANDFWESGVARPDLILADIIAILHPNILPEHELVYAKRVE